jgi:molecular chaperone DnaK (HSP70)
MKTAFDVLMRNRQANQRRTEFIITVPAIWTEKSKDNMRAYAAQAGMGTKGAIQIIKEPEAAGIYALVKMRNLGLELDDTFVLCDAGGG